MMIGMPLAQQAVTPANSKARATWLWTKQSKPPLASMAWQAMSQSGCENQHSTLQTPLHRRAT